MNRSIMFRPIPVVVFAGGLIASRGSAAAATSHTFKGPTEQTPYGPVQVSMIVKGKRIINLKIAAQPKDVPSQSIQRQAFAVLKREVLKAQSANVHTVSGATETSKAYISSLKGALKKAHLT